MDFLRTVDFLANVALFEHNFQHNLKKQTTSIGFNFVNF